MNVTEKQKELLISFMEKYPDFGRGRLRYNSENKRKIDELWQKVSLILNSAACGPYKCAKEWAKTWRDWKCNTLKKVAKQKSYMIGTGGGSPKQLQLTAIEKTLIEFLTPDASGLTGISEGGIEDVMPSSNYNETSTLSYDTELEDMQDMFHNETLRMNLYGTESPNLQKDYLPLEINESDSDSINSILLQSRTKQKQQPIQDVQTNIKKGKYTYSSLPNKQNIQIENKENVLKPKETVTSLKDTQKKRVLAKKVEDIKKPRIMATAIDLMEKKSSYSENIKQKMLELKETKLELTKEKLTVHKEILQELQNMNIVLSSLKEHFIGQYLEEF